MRWPTLRQFLRIALALDCQRDYLLRNEFLNDRRLPFVVQHPACSVETVTHDARDLVVKYAALHEPQNVDTHVPPCPNAFCVKAQESPAHAMFSIRHSA